MAADVAFVDGWLYVPLSLVPDVRALKSTLTVSPKGFKDYEPPKPIPCFRTDREGYIGVPIDWGMKHFPETMEIEDRTSMGFDAVFPKRPDPNHPLAPPGQAQFMDDVEAAMRNNMTVLAKAGTGTGKTVTAMEVSARLGRTTLVQVHLERLMKQWIAQGKDKLGLADNQIGIVQGDRCDWVGKPLVIAMMPTLARHTYNDRVYRAFGTLWQDEVHKVGSKMLSECLGQFHANYKGALTATVERTDGAHEVYLKYYGKPRVVSEQKPQPLTVYPVNYKRNKGTYSKGNRTIWVRQIVSDDRRNKMLAFYLHWLRSRGHAVLAVSESIDHLDAVAEVLMERHGVKANQIGFHTHSHNDPETGKRVKTTDEYFEWVQRVPGYIFGTYGTLTEGVDIPRLSAGMDLVPRAKSKQLFGRVRRLFAGKPPAEWITPIDIDFKAFENAFYARMRDVRDDDQVKIGKL